MVVYARELQASDATLLEYKYEPESDMLPFCNDHSSYRVDRVPIDFHEYISVDT